MTGEEYRFDGALAIFMENRKQDDWMIAEAISDKTKAPYLECLSRVQEMRRIHPNLPPVSLFDETSDQIDRRTTR